MCSSIEISLSTYNMLNLIGVETSILNMSSTYIAKDIIGQLGSLYFMNKISDKVDTSPVSNVNKALILQQLCISIEYMSPIVPSYLLLPILGISNIGQNISFVVIGSINTKVIQQIAIDNNICEVYSKLSLLNTLASSVGMTIGIIINTYVDCIYTRCLFIPIIGYIRIYSYNKSINILHEE